MGGGGGGGGSIVQAAVDPTSAANMAGASRIAGAAGVDNPLQKLNGRGPLSGMIGQAGGAAGTGFEAPQMANIQQGTTQADVAKAQGNAVNSLQAQNNLLNALQGQNGLGMQNTAAGNQTNLANQLQNANGVGVQQGAISGLQNTAGMYQNIAQGRGPNPAQAMLNQATGQNVANQAALMAGQRGAGANVGLMARQAAQQGAATQQQAAGQGATMQANQQLNALSGLTGTQQAIGGMGAGLTNQQAGANQQYANQANTMAGQQIAQTNANAGAALQNQAQMQNALQGYNNNVVGSQGNVNTGNAGLAQTQMGAQQGILGGLMSGIGAAAGAARGGEVKQMADGGPMTPAVQPNMSVQPPPPGPSSSFGQFLSGWNPSAVEPTANEKESESTVKVDTQPMDRMGSSAVNKGASKMTAGIGKMAMASEGGLADKGGHVKASSPSQKAVKSGNSYSNDKIPAKLSEGEIVLPRSVTMSSDPVGSAASFVEKVLAKRKGGK